jgi:DNA primase
VPAVAALGIPGSSSWKSGWLAAIDSFERVYLSFDPDEAGRKLAEAVMADVPKARYVQLPAGADTRAFLQRCGRPAYLDLLRGAEAVYRMRRAVNVGAEACRRAQKIRNTWEAA